MLNHNSNQFARVETTCGSLLCELQKIWDEVGEPDAQRDTMLVEIEQLCLEVYRRKVDEAKKCKAQLLQAISVSQKEIAEICSALGEQPVYLDHKAGGSLKEELKAIIPQLEDLRKRKLERKNQFVEVLSQLQKISDEICRLTEDNLYKFDVDETDLSVKRLEDLRSQLGDLQSEKSNRLKEVEDQLKAINLLCMVLDMDFKDLIRKIHHTLDDSKGMKDVSNTTIERLATTIQSLRSVKMQRMQRLQDLATALLELWILMDTPAEEQQMFQNVTSNIAASEPEITEPNMLSLTFIRNVEEEVSRLEQLKSSKMKELVLKKKLELEDICRRTHMVTEVLHATEYSVEAVESGSVEPVYLLEQIELQIAKVKEEAYSRKDILDKVEKWVAACEEESWLEEYNRDENRYNAGRGAHLALRRAEKARAVISKIPAMVDTLTLKVTSWEKERGTEFTYDGGRLLSMLEQYSSLRQEKEQERQRQRDQKRLQEQMIAEKEARYGSKPSPSKSGKKASTPSIGVASNRKLSLGGAMLQNSRLEKSVLLVHPNKMGDSFNRISYLGCQQSGGYAVRSSGRKSEIAGHVVVKKHSSNTAKARGIESPLVRKPLSPVLTGSSKANIANFLEDQNRTQNGTLQRTPSKSISTGHEENRTPKTMPIPVPTTPSTLSVPMLMATTPATPFVSFGAKTVEKIVEKVEYSFEEVRAGFICPRTQS